MMSIPEPQRLFNVLTRTLRLGAQIQLMPDAVAGGHDCFSARVGKSFKGRLRDGRAMAFIKLPGKGVENIGVEVELFFRVWGVVGRKRNILARDLTFYELRMLELARALATTPQLLFIDEVMAGLNPGEAKNAIHMIARAKEQFGITVFWIEHVMAVLMEAADRIVAINYGAKLAEGTPDEVVNNDDVIEAYLGRGWREYA